MVTTSGPIPTDQTLYMKVKEKVKKNIQKTSRWPSAYGSAKLIKQYKKEFKEKYGSKKNPYIEKKSTRPKKSATKLVAKQIKTKKSIKVNKSKKCPKGSRRNSKTGRCRKSNAKKSNRKNSGLKRWFNEKWVNVCEKRGKSYAPCGRKKVEDSKKYPYCRPLHRINKGTPMTVSELIKKHGLKKIKQMCSKKNTGNSKRIIYL